MDDEHKIIWHDDENEEPKLATKAFILNAPPRSGKDSLKDYMIENTAAGEYMFKAKLFAIAYVSGNFTPTEWQSVWIPRYESDLKDEPWERLGGLSQRQYLIKISEEWIKPTFGNDYFGICLADSIRTDNLDLAIISDGGFPDEVQPLIDILGKENVFILQWNKKGCSFDNDSRNYITEYPENIVNLGENIHGELEDFCKRAHRIINGLLV